MAANQNVNADLTRERQNATFSPEQLTYFLYNGPEKTKRKRFLQNLVIQDLRKLGFKQYATVSREEQYEQGLQKYAYLADTERKLDVTSSTDKAYIVEAVFPCEAFPYALHHAAFVNTFAMLASEEQKAKWLPLMKDFHLVGTYVQTEMGHGSFLRGLETTATYDPSTQEFVLHSPTISSIKYWPGGLGKTANACIVMAQLITKGHNYGMHSFLLQIRDSDTHQPLPGIAVGDIGNKFGFNANDNGFLKMDNVRIPRNNMLMRHSQILPDGTYIKPKNDRLMYGGMTSLRAGIVGTASRRLCIAATIAIRYSAVRRQSKIEPGAGEVQVLDFQTQQYRLFPQLAAAYATTIASTAINMYYSKAATHIEQGDLQQLPLLHALSAGLKAYTSWTCADGVEVCRLACGGHGYSEASGLPKAYVDTTPACTYEGENYVLILQTARYLVKCCRMLAEGEQVPEVMNFLRPSTSETSRLDARLLKGDLIQAFAHRAARVTREAAQSLQTSIGKGENPGQAWNSNSVQLVAAAKAFTQLYVVRVFAEAVETMRGSLRRVMESLWRLFAVHNIVSSLGDFLVDGYLSTQQVSLLESAERDLLKELRPDAVSLVDALDFPDGVLDSALGRWDGQVYEALYDYSLRSKLNEKQVLDAYHKYQRPFMESQWKKHAASAVTSRL
ncbi:peroxisomal acyl-coenzyme A oxidase 1-like [Littorina saxatilis]|uniref:Acyl-coenzyme A oxidase n=1 Tax=Littorina saxatilis TaxID=31220 RepID=A0AAN9ARX0_9CAEN